MGTVVLPHEVDADRAEAAYADGILEMKLPKKEQNSNSAAGFALAARHDAKSDGLLAWQRFMQGGPFSGGPLFLLARR